MKEIKDYINGGSRKSKRSAPYKEGGEMSEFVKPKVNDIGLELSNRSSSQSDKDRIDLDAMLLGDSTPNDSNLKSS